MLGKQILIIDDDVVLCQTIRRLLLTEKMSVIIANDGRNGLQAFYRQRPDLVLLDIHMPDIDGWEVCRIIRTMTDTPVLMVTMLDSDKMVARGFACGADDYVTKPFGRKILLSHVQALLRRSTRISASTPTTTYNDGYLSVDLMRLEVYRASRIVHLSTIEFRLLDCFLKHVGKVITHQTILHHVWGSNANSIEYVHAYVWHLRKKLEIDPRNPTYLVTERGVGYRFVSRTPHYYSLA